MTLRPAFRELLALAAATRPDWDWTEIRDALVAAGNAGWTWEATLREMTRLILRDDEAPVTLRNSARRTRSPGETGPEVNARGKAAVLAAIAEAHEGRQEAPPPQGGSP